jgi:ABC-2 type transport system permease protein
MIAAVVAKYGAFFRIAAAEATRARGELYGRVVFFAVILGVFSSLWHAVAEAGMPVAADPKALVWYLAITEWIVLSAPPMHNEIQEAIRRGDVACQLGRPVSYIGASLAEGLGVLAVRSPVLGATAFVCAFVFTGQLPTPSVWARVVPFGVIGAALMTGMHLGIGLLAFWLEDVSPVYWVWQKLMFVLGGMMLPIDLYPAFMQRAASLMPFRSMVAGPASFVLPSQVGPGALARQLAMWSGVSAVVLWWLFRRATATLTFNGG